MLVKIGDLISGNYVAQSNGKRHPDEHHTSPRQICGIVTRIGKDANGEFYTVDVGVDGQGNPLVTRQYRTFRLSGFRGGVQILRG